MKIWNKWKGMKYRGKLLKTCDSIIFINMVDNEMIKYIF